MNIDLYAPLYHRRTLYTKHFVLKFLCFSHIAGHYGAFLFLKCKQQDKEKRQSLTAYETASNIAAYRLR